MKSVPNLDHQRHPLPKPTGPVTPEAAPEAKMPRAIHPRHLPRVHPLPAHATHLLTLSAARPVGHNEQVLQVTQCIIPQHLPCGPRPLRVTKLPEVLRLPTVGEEPARVLLNMFDNKPVCLERPFRPFDRARKRIPNPR